MTPRIELPPIAVAEQTPLVLALAGLIEQLQEQSQRQAQTIQQLCEELAALKGEKRKRKFK
jgi:hypothetical protein